MSSFRVFCQAAKFIPDLQRPVDSFDWKLPNLLQLLSDSLITWKTKVKSENMFNSWRMIGSRWQIYVFAKILLIPNFWKSWQSVNFKFVKTLKFVYFLFPEKLRIYKFLISNLSEHCTDPATGWSLRLVIWNIKLFFKQAKHMELQIHVQQAEKVGT